MTVMQTFPCYYETSDYFGKVENKVCASNHDAAGLMYSCKYPDKQFDIIDLDPYGTASPFIDSAVQAVKNGGLLCITCTDMAVLCGVTPEACFAKYGSVSIRNCSFVHEKALRILLYTVSCTAARYGRYIIPLLSMSIDYYIRIFVQVKNSKLIAKDAVMKTGYIYYCHSCDARIVQPISEKITTKGVNTFKYNAATGPNVSQKCSICNRTWRVGGPLWIGNLHDISFLEKLRDNVENFEYSPLKNIDRIKGLIGLLLEELPDVPFYYEIGELFSKIHATTPQSIIFRSALLHAGYRVSSTHCKPNCIKTDAPPHIIWHIVKCWCDSHPVSSKWLTNESVSKTILDSPKLDWKVNFEVHPRAESQSKIDGLLRYPVNPPNWGPRTRATRNKNDEATDEMKNIKRKKTTDNKKELKQFLCKRYEKSGDCEYGDECQYSHEKIFGDA